jgi:aspartate kinase
VAAEAVDAATAWSRTTAWGSRAGHGRRRGPVVLSVLRPCSSAGNDPVVTGFIGATPRGAVTTLGRAGATSAPRSSGGIDAQAVIIRTDVPGWDDGRSSRRTIGAHDRGAFISRSLRVGVTEQRSPPEDDRRVIELGIELWIRNTFDPANPVPGSSPKRSQAPESCRR